MDFESLKVYQLKDICREKKIKGYSNLNKKPLIKLINDNHAEEKNKDVFMSDQRNGQYIYDSKLRPFGKLVNGKVKNLSAKDISLLKEKGYSVLEVDVKVDNNVIFDISEKEYEYSPSIPKRVVRPKSTKRTPETRVSNSRPKR